MKRIQSRIAAPPIIVTSDEDEVPHEEAEHEQQAEQ